MKQTKSTILNREFKETYRHFLFDLMLNSNISNTRKNILALAYYLTLHDRIKDAEKIYEKLKKDPSNSEEGSIQTDYMSCYLDMYLGYPNFATARALAEKYKNYPIITWRKMFTEVFNLLQAHDESDYIEPSHEITLSQRGSQLIIDLPPKRHVQLLFHAINQ